MLFQTTEKKGEGRRAAEILFLAAVDGETRACQIRVFAGRSVQQGWQRVRHSNDDNDGVWQNQIRDDIRDDVLARKQPGRDPEMSGFPVRSVHSIKKYVTRLKLNKEVSKN